jgi:hypothetical protein
MFYSTSYKSVKSIALHILILTGYSLAYGERVCGMAEVLKSGFELLLL